ncbi:MAG: lysophospholipid acyltransferase family protein [Coriobacteriia bacterium]|nr:lysophospholipid acyltransferase family protein [Coriobacteriia bacterium]
MAYKFEELYDLPLEPQDGGKRVPRWFTNLVTVVLGGLCKLLFRLEPQHLERIRAFQGRTGVLVTCNHTSFLDVVMLFLVIRPKQWVRYMARDTLFGNAKGFMGYLISRLGAFPVARDSADRTSIKRASTMLKRGEIVGIMPEGTRRGKSGTEPKIHSGAAFVARMGKVPILPATVRNAEKVKEKGKFVRFPKITVDFANPVLLSDFDFVDKKDRLDAASWYVMRESFALFQNVPREQVDMVALFPTGRDFTQLFAEHPVPEHTVEEVLELFDPKQPVAQAESQGE